MFTDDRLYQISRMELLLAELVKHGWRVTEVTYHSADGQRGMEAAIVLHYDQPLDPMDGVA